MNPTRWTGALALVLLLLAGAEPGWADDDADARIERLERALEAQQEEIRRLKQRRVPEAAPSTLPATPTVPSTVPPTAPGAPAPQALEPGAPSAPLSLRAKHGTTTADFDQTVQSVIGTTAARRGYRGSLGGVQLGGYTTLEFVANSEKDSYFDLHRFVLQVNAPISERIGIAGEIEWEHGGNASYLDGGAVKIEYVDVLFQVCDAFNPKLGALLIPFGRFNLFHDDPLNDFTMRPWTGRYMVPAGWGQPGIGAEGVFPLGCTGALSYNVAVTNGFDDGFTTDSGARGARTSWKTDNNATKQVWGRMNAILNVPRTDNFELGLSGTWSRYDDNDDHDLFGFGADFNVLVGPFEFEGEYVQYDLDRDPSAPIEDPRRQSALWLEAAYHFMPCGWNCPRKPFVTWTSHFTLAFRYQHMDLNDRMRGGAFNDDLQSFGASLNYRITEDSVFRVDWTYFDAVNEEDRTEFTASFSTYF